MADPMPDPRPAPVPLPATDEELISQCRVETFRASGKGGQHVNKTESAVRMTHLPSGIVAVCQRERSQFLNKEICLRRLREKIEEHNRTPEERLATRVPRSAKRRSRIAKTRQSIKKRSRSRPAPDDE